MSGNLNPATEIQGLLQKMQSKYHFTYEESDRIARSAIQADPVRKAAQTLMERLDVIHEDPHYLGVWQCYQNHGGDYSTGPNYVKELALLRAALAETKEGE